MKWFTEWKRRRLERQLLRHLVAYSIAQTRMDENFYCAECDGRCEVCEKDCQDCD